MADCYDLSYITATTAAIQTRNRGQRYLPPHVVLYRKEEGACAQDEICVDGPYIEIMVYCVRYEYFIQLIQREEKQSSTEIGELEGKTARIIISQADRSTPLEV